MNIYQPGRKSSDMTMEEEMQAQIPYRSKLEELSVDELIGIIDKATDKYTKDVTQTFLTELKKPIQPVQRDNLIEEEKPSPIITQISNLERIYTDMENMRPYISKAIEETIQDRNKLSKLEVSSGVLKSIGKDIVKTTKVIGKGLSLVLSAGYAFPTFIRITNKEENKDKDFSHLGIYGFIYGVVNILTGAAILGKSLIGKEDVPTPLLTLPAIYFTTNTLSGAYEYVRYKTKKVKEEKLQEKLKNGISKS